VQFLATLNPHGGLKPGTAGTTPDRSRAKEALRNWRCHLFGIPESEDRQGEEAAKGDLANLYRTRIPREKALEVLKQGGKLSEADYLRCKVRYFSDGAVIGGKAFVEEMFAAFRDRFGPKRKDGARPLRGLAPSSPEGPLFNFRQLRTHSVTTGVSRCPPPAGPRGERLGLVFMQSFECQWLAAVGVARGTAIA
jgi:hypothetical protein